MPLYEEGRAERTGRAADRQAALDFGANDIGGVDLVFWVLM